ncbi:hypothetical protein BKA69DRAFT_1068515 [Paraphysoderma sedebokerense]|nr:hypothetical protein BKA69DRAFT_1068515 [Paraphysoderma sedebokerense]
MLSSGALESSETSKSHILVLSHLSDPTFEILSRILNRPVDDISSGQTIHWDLLTKYYSVTLRFTPHILDNGPASADVESQIQSIWNSCAENSDAVIYIFDKSKPSTFDSFRTLSTILESSSHQPSISLCVSVPSVQAEADTYHSTCLKAGFEYIDLINLSTAATSISDYNDDEGQTMCRVIDALQSHMWDGLEMKANSSTRFPAENTHEADAASRKVSSNADNLLVPEDTGTAVATGVGKNLASSSNNRSSASPTADHEKDITAQQPNKGIESAIKSIEDLDLDDFEQFEMALDKVKSFRCLYLFLPTYTITGSF